MKLYAKKEGRTLGNMVREAIDNVYKKKDALEERKQVALRAYQEGLISLGKLSEVLGIDPISARLYLKGHHISLNVQDFTDISQDVADA
jgi:predicted HTH domain antitoxin